MKVATITDDDSRHDVVIGSTFGEHEATIEQIRLCDMTVYPEAQRRFKPKWAAELANKFDPQLLGILTLNMRNDGSYAVINGQHRRAAGQIAGYNEFAVTCHVYRGLTLAEEAKLFLALNNNRNVAAIDMFVVGVLEGNETSVGVSRVLQEFGIEVGTGNHLAFMAVRTAKSIFEDSGAVSGEEAFRTALRIATDAWAGPETAKKGYLNGTIIHGLALMALMYGPKLDPDSMAAKLKKWDPQGLIGNIRGRRATHQGSSGTVARVVLTEIYNKGLGSTRQLEAVTTNRRPTFKDSGEE